MSQYALIEINKKRGIVSKSRSIYLLEWSTNTTIIVEGYLSVIQSILRDDCEMKLQAMRSIKPIAHADITKKLFIFQGTKRSVYINVTPAEYDFFYKHFLLDTQKVCYDADRCKWQSDIAKWQSNHPDLSKPLTYDKELLSILGRYNTKYK